MRENMWYIFCPNIYTSSISQKKNIH